MTVVRSLFSVAVLVGGLAACGDEAEPAASAWEEPAAYTYTLTSSEGERALIGIFRITVRDGEVTKAVGLDDSARRVVRELPDQVPTIGALLEELEQARGDDADTAEARYAADGHPTRIEIDRERNAVDDEVRYDISTYEPAAG
ncbi:hypothetical protein HLK59_18795 [Streptomyces sp. S3(2020)]|uniref:DUF6174 domain-containing protein n=1 Tax=Streptomyces sp. S3(2020) TaxID=2732044 RepID=UPI001487C3F0|nr:DUF6174 domain-containing protein [Streptomyces sp. S3(2020)]NNN32371.1 hypothetical protein [Streptomyces sp. S3(2020)]